MITSRCEHRVLRKTNCGSHTNIGANQRKQKTKMRKKRKYAKGSPNCHKSSHGAGTKCRSSLAIIKESDRVGGGGGECFSGAICLRRVTRESHEAHPISMGLISTLTGFTDRGQCFAAPFYQGERTEHPFSFQECDYLESTHSSTKGTIYFAFRALSRLLQF